MLANRRAFGCAFWADKYRRKVASTFRACDLVASVCGAPSSVVWAQKMLTRTPHRPAVEEKANGTLHRIGCACNELHIWCAERASTAFARRVVETNGRALVKFLRSAPGNKHLCLEEGTQSAWLLEEHQGHVGALVVTHAQKRKRGPKDSQRDAFHLAESLRRGAVSSAYKKTQDSRASSEHPMCMPSS